MSNELQLAFNEISELRSLSPEIVLEALQSALVSAYRRFSGASSSQMIETRVDPTTGRVRIFVEKEVVEDVEYEDTEVTLERARFYEPECEIGDTVLVQVEIPAKSFGRIAAQTAKQVILQKIREAERESLYEEFIDREGDLVTGTVQNINSSRVTLGFGRAEAILPRSQQIPGERHRPHDKVRVYVMQVERSNRGPNIIVSRAHRNMLRRLLEYEVPEIYNGQVEIKGIAREAGYRSKIAVAALQDGVDPVGACVGMRGIRIQNIVKELHDEKIDVIEWNNDPEAFISKALSPATVAGVYLDDDPYGGRTAVVLVPDDQLSLAIGREGQNARLAAKLTGWRIDIKSVTETVQGALENLEVPPISDIAAQYPEMVEDARRVVEKKLAELTVMPEEFRTLNKFATLIEDALYAQREEARNAYLEELSAVKATLPPELFALPVDALDIPEDYKSILEPLGNIGEVVLGTLTDEERIQSYFQNVEDENPMTVVQTALDNIMMTDLSARVKELEAQEAELEESVEEVKEAEEAERPVEEAVEDLVDEGIDEAVAIEETIDDGITDQPEVALDAFGQPIIEELSEPEVVEFEPEPVMADPVIEELYDDAFEEEEDYYDTAKSSKKKRKKERQKRRQLILDEDSGQVIAKRRRKGSRRRDAWEDEIDL